MAKEEERKEAKAKEASKKVEEKAERLWAEAESLSLDHHYLK